MSRSINELCPEAKAVRAEIARCLRGMEERRWQETKSDLERRAKARGEQVTS